MQFGEGQKQHVKANKTDIPQLELQIYQSSTERKPVSKPKVWFFSSSGIRSSTASVSMSMAAKRSIVTSPGFSSSIKSFPVAARFILPILLACDKIVNLFENPTSHIAKEKTSRKHSHKISFITQTSNNICPHRVRIHVTMFKSNKNKLFPAWSCQGPAYFPDLRNPSHL